MSVSVLLDRPHAHVTNLDMITGKVILTVPNNESISLIVVKLEGESISRVDISFHQAHEQGMSQRGKYGDGEIHKLLYQVATVFPTADMQKASQESTSYTLPPGRYEYPFQFKIPINSSCFNPSPATNGLLGEYTRASCRHVKNTLPPSLCVLPGQAEIRYFVKTTVHRQAFYKENFRALALFNFLPIEPPRAPPNRRESFARVQHQFAPNVEGEAKPGFFRHRSSPSTSSTGGPPKITLDGRLPDPAIITCNEPLPLRILVAKLNESNATIYVKFFSVELVGHTDVRAHELDMTDTRSWVIVSSSNMRMALDSLGSAESGKPTEIDPNLWRRTPIPNTVAPSFETCNLSRRYKLHIKVGLSYGTSEEVFPELTVQTLHMPVQVYSGIAPPPVLLARMANQPSGPPPPPFQSNPPNFHPSSSSPTSSSSNPLHPPLPPRPSVPAAPNQSLPEDPPPSYEDAIADDIGPVDGPRRDYNHQPQASPTGSGDEKASGEMGRDERLFPDSGSGRGR